MPSPRGASEAGQAGSRRLSRYNLTLARTSPMRSDDLYSLPADLPVPQDDRACAHLPGKIVPPVPLRATTGEWVRLDQSTTPWSVIFAYPRTGTPDKDSPPG